MSRIIAGSRRGRRIAMPDSGRTRPTTDRVREALFSALASWAGTAAQRPEQSLHGLSFCDLFAGSGAVGLEAASRGAAPVLLVEADKRTARLTSANVAALGLSARVVTSRAETLVLQPAERAYDIVFADPPYDLDGAAVEAIIARLLDQGWLAPDGLVVVERSRRSADLSWPRPIGVGWSKRYGETTLQFGRDEAVARAASGEEPDR